MVLAATDIRCSPPGTKVDEVEPVSHVRRQQTSSRSIFRAELQQAEDNAVKQVQRKGPGFLRPSDPKTRRRKGNDIQSEHYLPLSAVRSQPSERTNRNARPAPLLPGYSTREDIAGSGEKKAASQHSSRDYTAPTPVTPALATRINA